MRVIVGGRASGKTTQMLAWMRDAPEGEHRVLVCHNRARAMQLLRENLDLASWKFISMGEFDDPSLWCGVLRGRGGRILVGIEDLDLILSQMFGWPIGSISITGTAYVLTPLWKGGE